VDRSLRITIDLALTEPVSGSVARDGGRPIRFSGWLDLHSALEELCEAAGDDRAPVAPAHPRRR